MDSTRADQLSFAKHFAHAQGWLWLENFPAARRSLAKIPAVHRRRPEVLALRADLHLALQEWAKAAPLLRRVVKLTPHHPQYWVSLAYAVRRAESIEAAEAVLQHARACFPDVAVIWFNLACYAAQQARWADVDALLPEAVRLEPAFADAAKIDPDLAPYWQHRKRRDAAGLADDVPR